METNKGRMETMQRDKIYRKTEKSEISSSRRKQSSKPKPSYEKLKASVDTISTCEKK